MAALTKKVDDDFFDAPKPKKQNKLTKAQKRALKFAMKKGIDPDTVDLSQAGKKTKHKKHVQDKGIDFQARPKGNKF